MLVGHVPDEIPPKMAEESLDASVDSGRVRADDEAVDLATHLCAESVQQLVLGALDVNVDEIYVVDRGQPGAYALGGGALAPQ
eukprot:6205808-Pleurochrysis_carterae.AAC.5